MGHWLVPVALAPVSLFLEQRRLAAVKVWRVARTAHPTSFVGAVVNSQLSWPVDAAVWRRPCVLHGRVFRGDLAIAPEAYPFCLPLACGLVHGGGPLHEFGMAWVDQRQAWTA